MKMSEVQTNREQLNSPVCLFFRPITDADDALLVLSSRWAIEISAMKPTYTFIHPFIDWQHCAPLTAAAFRRLSVAGGLVCFSIVAVPSTLLLK